MSTCKRPQQQHWLVYIIIAQLLFTSGCAVFFRPHSGQRPFEPATEEGDLVFVRTGDHRYYYVVDTARDICYFHAPMYGRKHLVQIACADLPEYDDIVAENRRGSQPPAAAEPPATPTTKAARRPVPTTKERPAKTQASAQQAKNMPTVDDDQMQRIVAAFNELQCNRRKGKVEGLETFLERHKLSLDTWERAMESLQAQPERWTKLHDDADAACKQ